MTVGAFRAAFHTGFAMVALQGVTIDGDQGAFVAAVAGRQAAVALGIIGATPEGAVFALPTQNRVATTIWTGEVFGDMAELFDVLALALKNFFNKG